MTSRQSPLTLDRSRSCRLDPRFSCDESPLRDASPSRTIRASLAFRSPWSIYAGIGTTLQRQIDPARTVFVAIHKPEFVSFVPQGQPIHTIKIDQTFVREIQSDHGHYPVVLAIISIAKGLGLRLIAEGVETEIQSRYLEQSGCAMMQGYLYYQPLSSEQLLQALRSKIPISA